MYLIITKKIYLPITAMLLFLPPSRSNAGGGVAVASWNG